ncbi:MAG: 50S ribosomal protein L22 [Thermoleophilia bacterium]|jgi:large subunit ribosomal protein L22
MADKKKKADKKTEPKKAGRKNAEVEAVEAVRATAKHVRVSARKMRLVADTVRGKDLAAARTTLAFSTRAAAKVVDKVIASAAANAENNHDLSVDDLFVSSIFVNEGPTLKRFRPRAMGRASRIRKRTSHVTVELAPRKEG